MISKILNFLNITFEYEGYYVREFSDGLFFGKDRDNNVICARVNDTKEQAFSMTTKAIDLYQNYHFILKTETEELSRHFDMLILKNSFVDTKSTFINLCLNFYGEDSDRSVVELTRDLIDMYKIVSVKDTLLEQGLWAELFTILYLYNNLGLDVSKNWHSDGFNKYDFSFSEDLKLEVKSTLKEIREHNFSHEQIYTDYDVIISSVQMRKEDSGYSVFDLYSEVEQLFTSKYDLLLKVGKELKKLDRLNVEKYDLNYSMDNIKFFINKNVPKFNVPEPVGVHGTQYVIVLENVEKISDSDILKRIKISYE
jgi:hypothetical protein